MTEIDSPCQLIRCGAALLLLGILTAQGCSSKSKVIVSGKVTYQGQPVRPGNVQLFDSQNMIVSMADLNADGTFIATDVPPGEVQVAVRVLPNIAIPKKKGDAATGSVDDVDPASKPVRIPLKYQDPKTSGLHYTIGSGDNQLVITLQ